MKLWRVRDVGDFKTRLALDFEYLYQTGLKTVQHTSFQNVSFDYRGSQLPRRNPRFDFLRASNRQILYSLALSFGLRV